MTHFEFWHDVTRGDVALVITLISTMVTLGCLLRVGWVVFEVWRIKRRVRKLYVVKDDQESLW